MYIYINDTLSPKKKNRTVRYELKFNHNKHTRICSMIFFFIKDDFR